MLLDEVVSSTVQRCIDPVLMEPKVTKLHMYRRVKLLGVALYYIIYRSRDPNLCRAKR